MVFRLNDYAFVIYAALMAVSFATALDHVTLTLSPEYFLYGRGLALDARPLRWAVTLLAIRDGFAVGLCGGAVLVLANKHRQQTAAPFAHSTLVKLSFIPVAVAGLLGAVASVVNASAQIGTQTAIRLGVVPYRLWRFAIVWAFHVGSCTGALVGVVAGAMLILVRRRRPLVSLTSRLPRSVSNRVQRALVRGGSLVLLGYVSLCVAGRLGYRVLLYPAPPDPPLVPPEGAKLLSLRAEDGAMVAATQFHPTDANARTIVIFHGNGETMANHIQLAEDLWARGLGVVLSEFRGYGLASSSGPPNELGLYRDAAAILYELERQGIGPQRVSLVGISLGTGVAAEMAVRGLAASLILVSPYTSITAMAASLIPFLPTSLLCPDRFDTLSKALRIHVPTLVIHGDADEVVPFAMGQQVAAAIPGAEFRVVRGGHHNDLFVNHREELEARIAEYARR